MSRWLDPRPGLYAEAVALERGGDLPAAARAYRTVSGLWPAHRQVVRYNLASVLARQGCHRRAARLFTALADDPAAAPAVRAGAHFHLGRLREANGATLAARDHYRASLVIVPEHGAARERLASLAPMDASGDGAPLPAVRRRPARRMAADGPILVYQMGKVASNSAYLGLRAALPQQEVVHSHLLHPESFAHYERWFAADPELPATLVASTREQIAAGDGLRRRMLAGGARWRIVSLTREPIAHLISVLFHHLTVYVRRSGAGSPPRLDVLHAYAIESLRRWIAGGQAADLDAARAALTLAHRWFDDELGPVLGLDVYATPYPFTRGYLRRRASRADVVIVRVEDLPWAGAEAMRALCGVDQFALPAANRAGDRESGRLYEEYRQRYRFPAALVAAVYATRYATHFYTEAERAALTERWTDTGR
jgi:hypothetical protein